MAELRRATFVLGFCLLAVVLAGGPALAATKVTVTVSDVRTTSAQISWTETNDTCFQDYRLQYQRTTAAGWSDDVVINSSTTTSYRTVGYTPDISYNFRVVDENCTGVQASDPVSFHTLPLPSAGEVAAGFGSLFLAIIVLALIGAGAGFVLRLAKRAALRAIMPGASKDIPTASLPGVSSDLPTPTPGNTPSMIPTPTSGGSSSMYQGGQRGGTAQPAVPPVPRSSCLKCGAPLTGAICGRCGHKNW